MERIASAAEFHPRSLYASRPLPGSDDENNVSALINDGKDTKPSFLTLSWIQIEIGFKIPA